MISSHNGKMRRTGSARSNSRPSITQRPGALLSTFSTTCSATAISRSNLTAKTQPSQSAILPQESHGPITQMKSSPPQLCPRGRSFRWIQGHFPLAAAGSTPLTARDDRPPRAQEWSAHDTGQNSDTEMWTSALASSRQFCVTKRATNGAEYFLVFRQNRHLIGQAA